MRCVNRSSNSGTRIDKSRSVCGHLNRDPIKLINKKKDSVPIALHVQPNGRTFLVHELDVCQMIGQSVCQVDRYSAIKMQEIDGEEILPLREESFQPFGF